MGKFTDKTRLVHDSDQSALVSLRREVERHRIAQELVRRVTPGTDVHGLVEDVLAVSFDLFPADGASIALASGVHLSRSRRGGGVVQVPRRILEEAYRRPEGVLVGAADGSSLLGGVDRGRPVLSAIAAPLVSRGRTLGVLYLDNLVAPSFTPEDVHMLVAVSAQAAMMVENAQLVQQTKADAQRRAQLARFLSPALVEQALSGGLSLPEEGQTGVATVLFADIRGFTELAERTSARDTLGLLNRFFREMSEAVFTQGGIVDKLIGDCVMAVWGAPVPAADDARRALRAGLSMIERAGRVVIGGSPLQIGVGVHTGEVVLGCVGSEERLDYTVIGSAVNLASRLCALAPAGEMLTTRATLDGAGDGVRSEPTLEVHVKGLKAPVVPYLVRGVAD